ncbi:ANTAR domain-containing protein, partial [Rhodococcus sp. HNM0569]|uniref:ANTAR domain-containing response regulator n=1 Tax=Rhodococcus sp. HNM0569 TaxID=2716340 RepID=UPI00146E3521
DLDGTSGALILYSTRVDAFDEVDAALLDLYVTAASRAVRDWSRYRRTREHVEQLRTALASRAVIDQAKGIVMALRGVDAEEAFALLVAQSQQQNVKLRDIAEGVVDTAVDAAHPR